MTDYLFGTDQKIPDPLIKIAFLEKVETAIMSAIKSRFSILAVSIMGVSMFHSFFLELATINQGK